MSKLKGTILIVEDDEDVLFTTRLVLQQQFTQVLTEPDPKRLPYLLGRQAIDVIILDMNFGKGQTSGNEGLYWLREILKTDPQAHVIMHTAYGDIQLAVEAMKIGAMDFLVKPWEQEKLVATVANVYKLRQSNREISRVMSRESHLNDEIAGAFPGMIGASAAMARVQEMVKKVAATDASVLVLGENGTGKELVAREIHRLSDRGKSPLIKVDMGSLTDSLFESELFGHKKGAFTDAREDRKGRFEIASGSTLFLDEIGNLSLVSQAKLLSVLQGKQVVPVGSNISLETDIRLICATNSNLHEMVEKQVFRPDLLYRINTVEITLPPLRQRKEDIAAIANHYLSQYRQKYGKPKLDFSTTCLKKLESHLWPGNIRELQHAVERAVILTNLKKLEPEDFPFDQKPIATESIGGIRSKDEMEKSLIRQALQEAQGNLTHVSQMIGMGRTTLYRKMKKYGL